MTKQNKLNLIILAVFFVLAGMIMSCEGPQGPAGKDGVDGKDGKDGAPGTAVCEQCHNASTDLVAKQSQWAQSKHGQGSAFIYANRTACAACHTSEGYLETADNDGQNTAAVFNNPSTINCRTCHNVHKNYDDTDWGFTSVKPFKFRYDGQATEVDLRNANLCARCHQARPLSPGIVDGQDVTITSFRWGPHYGGQSNILMGHSAFSLDGSTLPSGTHKNINGACFKCHMAGPSGTMVGGHSFMTASVNEETLEKTINNSGCLSSGCHTSVDSKWNPDGGTKATDIYNNLLAIREILAAKGWLDTTNAHGNPGHDYVLASTAKPLVLTSEEAKILANYLVVSKDKSLGIHNPRYVNAVLKQTLNALQ